MNIEQIEEQARAARPDLQLHGISVTRTYPLPGTAWDTDNGLALWCVRIKTIDDVTSRTQLLTATHEGEGSELADAVVAALVKLSAHNAEARRNRPRAPFKPWFQPAPQREPDEPENVSDPHEWVREEIQRRVADAHAAREDDRER